jgi:2'-5' RNA ligase
MVAMLGPSHRAQVSLFLPDPVATVVQDLRARFDPGSAQIIRPHITALYESELSEAAPGIEVLADCASMRQTFQVELSEPRLWNNGPSDGIYVGVDDVDEGISSLRDHFLMRGLVRELSPDYVPHVTSCMPAESIQPQPFELGNPSKLLAPLAGALSAGCH